MNEVSLGIAVGAAEALVETFVPQTKSLTKETKP